MKRNNEKKFEKIVTWEGHFESAIVFWTIAIISLFLAIILSPIFSLIFYVRQFKDNWSDRKVYWREIK